jgi:hypothetical protein
MPHSEARAWWAEVEHLRDGYERTDEARRRADEADLASRREMRERSHADAEVSAMRSRAEAPPVDALESRRRAASPFSDRRGHTDGGLDPHRGRHVDLPPAPRVRQGIAPPSGSRGAVPAKGSATPGRVTVEIRGRTVPAPSVPRLAEVDRRRPQRRPVERVGARPDRVAMWALLMGLLLILVAIGTADTPAVSSLFLAL